MIATRYAHSRVSQSSQIRSTVTRPPLVAQGHLAGTLNSKALYPDDGGGLLGYCDADWIGPHVNITASTYGYVLKLRSVRTPTRAFTPFNEFRRRKQSATRKIMGKWSG